MAKDSKAEAQAVREEGNALYKQGKYDEAAHKYHDAMDLDPDDPAPRANLSACLFETGLYTGSVKFGASAIRISKDDNEADVNRKQRLIARIKRCLQFERKPLEQWREWASMHDKTRTIVLDIRDQLSVVQKPAYDRTHMRRLMADRVPKYRPWMETEQEYFAVGHDTARSQFDEELMVRQPEETAFMFCGIGDARHFYVTLAKIRAETKKRPELKSKRYHFTLLDLKSATIARDLIVFSLLDDLSRQNKGSDEETDTLIALYYVWFGVVMPKNAYERLEKAIGQIILGLRMNLMPKWFQIPSQIRPSLIAELEGWGKGIDATYSTKTCREIVVSTQIQNRFHQEQYLAPVMSRSGMERKQSEPQAPSGCELDVMVFETTSALLTTEGIMKRTEPKLAYHIWGSVSPDLVAEYIDEHWRPNPTFVDLEWQKVRNRLEKDPDFAQNPFLMAEHFFEAGDIKPPRKPSSLFDYACAFFRPIGEALTHLHQCITIEVLIGEMSDIMERIHYDVLEERRIANTDGTSVALKHPRKYHRIHMSNIPDYTGGLMCSLLYAAPLLDHSTLSQFSSVVLRNPPAFDVPEDFCAEYATVGDFQTVLSLFQHIPSRKSPMFIDPHPLVMAEYLNWCPVAALTGRQGSNVQEVDRKRIEKFFHAMFLKLVLPFPRNTRDEYGKLVIYSPLNLAAFLKLVEFMHEIAKLPAHRLSDMLTEILDDNIVTSARAPRSSPLSKKEAETNFPSRRICIRPFSAEFTTLTAVWKEVLPFGFEHPTLPVLSTIAEYEVKLGPITAGIDFNIPHSGLLFWNLKIAPLPTKNLRKMLLDDEKGDRSAIAQEVRQRGVHVLSTFEWSSKTETVKFWLRQDVMGEMQADGEWNLYFLRTDLWRPASRPVRVTSITPKRRWIDS